MWKYGPRFPQADSINKRLMCVLSHSPRSYYELAEAGQVSQYGIEWRLSSDGDSDVWEMVLFHFLETFSIANVSLAARNDD